jgi:hypothetical protein
VALRLALASLPCAVLVLRLPAVLGSTATSWIVPLATAFANAFLLVSVARQLLGRAGFLLFWGAYGLVWALVAWHGFHFHGPPRPAALLLNLGQLAQTPLPDWTELPWTALAGALGLAWLARRPSPADPRLRLATAAAVLVFAAFHAATFVRYRTRDMLRLSAYGDLVRTHGLEAAAIMDAVELLHAPDTSRVLRDLRRDVATRPPLRLPLDPTPADRVVIVQIESLDREVLTPEVAPTLLRLWHGATHGLVDPQRTSLSGSSSADFQLLTGLRPLAGVPLYRLSWDGDGSGLPAHAAARGFAFHAYHGNDRHFWNRGPFLSAMGATFHAIDGIPQTEFSRWGRADGDLFRFAAPRIGGAPRAVHFLITLSTHAPFDLVDPAAHLDGASQETRYLRSFAYLDRALGTFLASLPRDGTTLVALYGDHSSGLFGASASEGEPAVPLILGRLAADGSLSPLGRRGEPVGLMSDVYELPALHRYVKDCLDASTP